MTLNHIHYSMECSAMMQMGSQNDLWTGVRAMFVPCSCHARARSVPSIYCMTLNHIHYSMECSAMMQMENQNDLWTDVRAMLEPCSCRVRAMLVRGSCHARARFVPSIYCSMTLNHIYYSMECSAMMQMGSQNDLWTGVRAMFVPCSCRVRAMLVRGPCQVYIA
jgi:hypothetical protein